MPLYPAASYQHASPYQPDHHLHSLSPTSLAIRVAVRGENGLTVHAMPISPRIRMEDLIHQLLSGNHTHSMNHRLLDILLMRRIVVCNVVLSVVGAAHPHAMPCSFF
jgi:hypothetical protein